VTPELLQVNTDPIRSTPADTIASYDRLVTTTCVWQERNYGLAMTKAIFLEMPRSLVRQAGPLAKGSRAIG
jgi:hypothetical protein